VHVLVAPDCFTGTLTAPQAAEAIAEGWHRAAPGDRLDLAPLSDGGPGFVEVLHAALGGRLLAVTVPGPLGDPTPASVLVVDGDPDGGPDTGRTTAYVESAQACGLHLVPPDRRDPGRTSTAGVADLLTAARQAGATRIVVGLGGSGTNDAGVGMLAALAGATPLTGGEALAGITPADLAFLPDLVRQWSGVELVAASDVDVPLLGFHGASAGYAEQKGATPEQAQRLERALADASVAACDVLGVPRKLASTPGAGAAGGLGFALLLLGATRLPGAATVLDAVRFDERVREADLLVTGEGCFDWQSLRGKVVAGAAARAMGTGTPVVVIAGQVLVGRREALAAGVETAYPVARTPAEVTRALADPYGTLAGRAERVARTWSH